jgi:hypothetical protein
VNLPRARALGNSQPHWETGRGSPKRGALGNPSRATQMLGTRRKARSLCLARGEAVGEGNGGRGPRLGGGRVRESARRFRRLAEKKASGEFSRHLAGNAELGNRVASGASPAGSGGGNAERSEADKRGPAKPGPYWGRELEASERGRARDGELVRTKCEREEQENPVEARPPTEAGVLPLLQKLFALAFSWAVFCPHTFT